MARCRRCSITQPRKHQVKDLKTKSVRIDAAGTVQLGGIVVQDLLNTIVAQAYDDFLAQSVTGLVGGADSSSPPILYGGFGPFLNIVAGNSITITLPGVNSGNPITIQVQSSDIVFISGNPVLTTSRVSALINATLSSFGVTTPVAANISGQLVLTGADTSGRTYGDDAFITITDITLGTLTKLGFATSPSSANGTTAPKRGIVTVSSDGLGGYVALRRNDQTPAVTFNPSLLTFPAIGGFLRYAEEVPPAQPVYAHLRQFPGPHDNGEKFEFSFFRKGTLRANLITSRSDFSSLSAADTVTFAVVDPVRGVNENVVVTFTIPPTSPQNVVDAVNAQWNLQTFSDTGYPASSAVIKLDLSGPYAFGTLESFFISFQTTVPIQIAPGPSVVTTTELAVFIQAAIVGAGAGAQGQAILVYDPATNQTKVAIRSLNTSGPNSLLTVYPGNPGGSTPADYMGTLEKVGLVPGTFKGSSIAALYGNDEVIFSNPSHTEGSFITISGFLATMARLGFALPVVSNTSALGVEPTLAPLVHTLIPEMMELGEVPDGSDTVTQQFSSIDDFPPVDPLGGTSNFGSSPVIGQDGRVIPNIIPKHYPFMALGQVDLGRDLTDSPADQSKPRVTTPFSTGSGPALLWESTSTDGNSQIRTRFYQVSPGITIETWNATYDGSNYVKDMPGVAATRQLVWEGLSAFSIRDAALGSPWTESDWLTPILFAPWEYSFLPLISLGDPSHETLTQNVFVPRIQFNLIDTNPSLVLQGQIPALTSTALRLYHVPIAGGGSFLADTVNAFQDDLGNWNKDGSGFGLGATAVTVGDSPSFAVFFQKAVNNAPWVVWDIIPYTAIADPFIDFYTVSTPGAGRGAWNFMGSPLKVPSVRRDPFNPIPLNAIFGGGTQQLILFDGVDQFVFVTGTAGITLINSIDMSTNMAYTLGDEFEVIINHFIGSAQITPDPSAWGPNVFWENPGDGYLSNIQGFVDVYKFKSIGFDATLANRRLLGSVTRYQIA